VGYGWVDAMVQYNGVLYVGGHFASIGPASGQFAAVDATTAAANATVRVDGGVRAIVLDGSGGQYVGGSFTTAGSPTSPSLIHVLAHGTLDTAFAPNLVGSVRALALVGSTLYVGGSFTNIGGQARTSLAAVDPTTGVATSFTSCVLNQLHS